MSVRNSGSFNLPVAIEWVYVRRGLVIPPLIGPSTANILQLHTPAMKMVAQYLSGMRKQSINIFTS